MAKTVGYRRRSDRTSLFFLSLFICSLVPMFPRSLSPHLVSGLRMRVGGEDQTSRLPRFGLEEEIQKTKGKRCWTRITFSKKRKRKKENNRNGEHGRGRISSCQRKAEPLSPNRRPRVFGIVNVDFLFIFIFVALVSVSCSLGQTSSSLLF